MDVVISPGLLARIPGAVCSPRTGVSPKNTHQDVPSHLLDSPAQTLPVREETPSSNLQLIQGAQTPLPPSALDLAAPKGSATAPDTPGFTHSSRNQAGTHRLSAGSQSLPAAASPALFPVSSA